MKLYALIIATIFLIASFSGCKDDEFVEPELLTGQSVTHSAECVTDSVRFSYNGSWTASTDGDWITLVCTQGKGNGTLPLYLQQNDSGESRQASVSVTFDNGQTLTVSVVQNAPELNTGIPVDLPRNFGLGWGYDIKMDYADDSGLRGQIFDEAKLRGYFGQTTVNKENSTSTHLNYAEGYTFTELQKNYSTSLSGEVNLLVAGVKLSTEYNKQLTGQKECRYIWCKDFRTVKSAEFANCVDYDDPETIKWCTTSAFWTSLKKDSPKELVRKFGTHLIISSQLGGKLEYYLSIAKTVNTDIETVINTVSTKLLFYNKTSQSVSEKVWQQIKEEFEGNISVDGGAEEGVRLNQEFGRHISRCEPISDDNMFNKWYSIFENSSSAQDNELALVDFQVIPIWELIMYFDEDRACEIEDYIFSDYLKK